MNAKVLEIQPKHRPRPLYDAEEVAGLDEKLDRLLKSQGDQNIELALIKHKGEHADLAIESLAKRLFGDGGKGSGEIRVLHERISDLRARIETAEDRSRNEVADLHARYGKEIAELKMQLAYRRGGTAVAMAIVAMVASFIAWVFSGGPRSLAGWLKSWLTG